MEKLRYNGACSVVMSLPPTLQGRLRINWHISNWCNYRCAYCGILIFNRRVRDARPQAHAFDHAPVERWLEALAQFPDEQIFLKITGGEPFLDRDQFRNLLLGLERMPHIRTGVDTNAFWDPGAFAQLDKTRLFLHVGFHPS